MNCFSVVAFGNDLEDVDAVIKDANSGRVANNMGAKRGMAKGPQVIVIAKITEFQSESATNSFGGFSYSSSKTSKIGFVVKLLDPETREIVASKSLSVESKTGGSSGFSFGGYSRKSNNAKSQAVQDAMEKGIIQAVEFIASKKSQFELPETEAQMKANKPEQTLADCNILKGSKIPKVMVILPEFHIRRRIPDPAAETEINKKLLEFGFEVVDAAMYATIANGDRFVEAAKDPILAISLGNDFGADIVIYGEAFSQFVETTNGLASCRARVEVKAVRTDNAAMLAANGLEAGAVDNAEFVAHKSALRSAGSLIADYMIEQLCKRTFK